MLYCNLTLQFFVINLFHLLIQENCIINLLSVNNYYRNICATHLNDLPRAVFCSYINYSLLFVINVRTKNGRGKSFRRVAHRYHL